MSLVCLLFDAVMIPFMIAWSPEVGGVMLVGMYFSAIFWTCDILVNMSTGFFTINGDLEYRPIKILARYMKTTMVIDLIIMSTDWVGIYLESLSGVSSDSEHLGVLRITKMNRIVRIG